MRQARSRSNHVIASRSGDSDGVGASVVNSDDDLLIDEKQAKVEKTQSERFRIFMLFFMFLAVIAFVVGRQQEEAARIHKQAVALSGGVSGMGFGGVGVVDVGPSEAELQRTVDSLDAKVRAHKKKPDMIMETDPEGLKLTKELQHATHKLLIKRYGRHKSFRIKVDLVFPNVIVEKDGLPREDYLLLELAPYDLIPCSVYNFLEIARTWKAGAFHRNAGHVLQVRVRSGVTKSMPFQEYSPEFPHARGTAGYAGRPSGPAWYVSIRDNTENHGPGSQQKHNPYEADSNFGRVVRGMDDVVPRMHSVPQNGWLDSENEILIPKMTILIPTKTTATSTTGDGTTEKEWIEWKPQRLDGVGGGIVSVK